MSQATVSQLYALGFLLLFVGFGVVRRMRPQEVRTNRILTSAILIVAVIGLSLVGAGGRIISDPIALLLIPVCLAAGVALGYYLVRTMTFWTDPNTGALWMKGGAIFALILMGTIVLRLGVRSIAYGSMFGGSGSAYSGFAPQSNATHGLLYDLSADLLFLTLGLWGARAYFLVRRQREHAAGVEAGTVQS
jgi:hypothetical protein